MIKPNQTGYAGLNEMSPIILDRPLPIFGDQKANPGKERHGDISDAVKETKENTGSSDPKSGTEQNSRGISNTDSMSGAKLNSNDPVSDTGQNRITQPDRLADSTLDLNLLEKDASPAPPGSVVVGAHLTGELLAVGSAQSGKSGETLLVEGNLPSYYANNATGFNLIDDQATMIDHDQSQVDSVEVSWGIYAGGIAFDSSGHTIRINYHPFAYAEGGATPPGVVSSIGGIATFSNVAGYTKPVTESGNIGGSVNLNVGVNLGSATVTSYNLAVTDANSRNWVGTLNNGPVPLSVFARNGAPLAVSCGGCGAGTASGSAAGMLIGPNAKGLISSYILSTTTGSAVAGAVLMSRP